MHFKDIRSVAKGLNHRSQFDALGSCANQDQNAYFSGMRFGIQLGIRLVSRLSYLPAYLPNRGIA